MPFLKNFFDLVAVGAGPEMGHDIPHGLHFVFIVGEIDIFGDPSDNFFVIGHFRQVGLKNVDIPVGRRQA